MWYRAEPDPGRLLNDRKGISVQVLFLATIGAICAASPVAYARLVAEDYWGENATFVAFLVSGVLFAFAAVFSKGSGWQRRAWYWLFSVATVFVALEEISWGQRILSIATPEALSRINNQNELTLHNISIVENVIPYTTVVSFAVLGYGFLIAAVSRLLPRVDRLVQKCGFVFPGLNLAPTFLAAVYLLMLPFYKSEELGELFVGFGMMLLAADHLSGTLAPRRPEHVRVVGPIVVCIGIISLWSLLGYVLVPALIESAYQGKSLEFVNRLISGGANHPLSEYVDTWLRLSHLGTAFIAAGVAIFGMHFWHYRAGHDRLRQSYFWTRILKGPALICVALGLGVFMSVASGQPGSFHTMLGELADRTTESGHHSRADTLLEFIETHDTGPRRDLAYRRARLAYAMGDSVRGAALTGEALALEMSGSDDREIQPDRWHRIGELHSQLGNSAAAVGFWNRALADYEHQLNEAASDKARADLHMKRAGTFMSMKSFNAAIDDYLRASLHAVQGIQKKRIWLGIVGAVNLCRVESGEAHGGLPAYWHSESWARVQELALGLDDPEGPRDWCSASWS